MDGGRAGPFVRPGSIHAGCVAAVSKPIEDYGFIGNALTGALVGRDGSIDWLCVPRFDSGSCFGALLGEQEHGCWRIAPRSPVSRVQRRYRPNTAVLETTFETAEGMVTVIDFMPPSQDERLVSVMRVVRGDRGRVPMRVELVARTDYGRETPWVRPCDKGLSLVAGPIALRLWSPVRFDNEPFETAHFCVGEGESVPFELACHPSHLPAAPAADCMAQLEATSRWWCAWSGRCRFARASTHPWHEAVTRSLITLKALTYHPSGGIIAAPTTSLPEEIGGSRNWDYRFCWIRDATLTLYALLASGYRDEAVAWREWLLRAAAGEAGQLQIMYGLMGERRLDERELPWLPGYANSRPVRIGNSAFDQRQLDVPGELMDALHTARKFGLDPSADAWELQKGMLRELERTWQLPDEGIWEVRGGKRHFTFSRLMCWVAFDRAVKGVEMFGLDGPVQRWRALRQAIAEDVWKHGWSSEKRSFVQYYGGTALDASLLLMAEVGFLPPADPRFLGTVAAIERELMVDGLVLRYRPEQADDGLPGGEGVFLACSFWLADAYCLLRRHDQARELFERLLELRNDLGLLAEEYDPHARRLLGNFPQAFSHVALINTANNLVSTHGPADQRADHRAGDALRDADQGE